MLTDNKPIVLVDGSSYLYRAFHALPPLVNSKGAPTGAIYGVINMLKRLYQDYQPSYMAVIFDAKGKTFRDDIYPAYKATRKEMPVELAEQIKPIHDIIKAMGLPILMIEGVEADDVIGSLTVDKHLAGKDIVVSTGDKDLAQLVNPQVTLINTMNNSILNPKNVEEKFGIPPERIVDYLTLVGDTSDNIPGVPLVGPKTAVKWLQQYQSLENIIAHAEQIKGKAGENLRASIPQFPMVKSLVTIKKDVNLDVNLSDLAIKEKDKTTLVDIFKNLEFKTWLTELLNNGHAEEQQKQNYDIVTTEEKLKEWVRKIKKSSLIAVDTETTSLNYMSAKIVGVSIACNKGEAAYIPFGHDYPDAPTQLSMKQVLDELKPLLEDQSIKKIGQNIKYDLEVLASHGIKLQGIDFDTMLESYVLDSTATRHDMDSLALKYLGYRTVSFEDVAGKGSKQLTFNQVELEKAAHYAAEDADITYQLHQTLWPKIDTQEGLKYIFEKIEMPLVTVLAKMELHGVLIDPEKLIAQGKTLTSRLKVLEKAAYELAGIEFNINSPKQLQEILFDKLGLPVLQKTPTGQASTADAVLQELAIDFELPKTIIEYRSISKLLSTYTSRLVEQADSKSNRIHTSYNQAGTATGRLSSSEPNLQNIPIRTAEGRQIRQAFIAPKGFQLVSADYSQIELRIMAHISQDPGLLQAFSDNLDIHKATAAEVWDVPLDQVTQDLRRNAKAINFGLIYGMSAFGLTRQLGIDRKSAEKYIEKYFQRYPKVREYMENTRESAREKGYVETIWGRRLYLPEIRASKVSRQKAAERTAINAPLQGSAADIIKMAMVRIDEWLKQEAIPVSMIMQVHDELVFEVPENHIQDMITKINEHMSSVVKLDVPLLVSIGHGDNWDAASAH